MTAAVLAGCSSTGSRPNAASPTPQTHVSTQPPGDDSVTLQVAPGDLHAENSWHAPHYALQWPGFDDAKGLSDALTKTVAEWRTSYLADTSALPTADLAVAWEGVMDARSVRGVRLTNRTTAGDVSTQSVSVYGTAHDTWRGSDLIAADQRSALLTAVREAAQKDAHVRADADDDDASALLQDVTFDEHGTMHLRIGEGAIAPMSAGTLYATVSDPERFLSAAGRTVRDAARSASNAPGASSVSPTSIAAPREHVDCTKLKCIALTFDDGPGPYTEGILDTLEKKHAKATFFMLGPAVQAAPKTVQRMTSLGMALGDHSWTHPQFTELTPAQVTQEITKQADAVEKITGQEPIAVRPPYGAFTKTTPHDGFPFVLWDVDTEDWKNRNATKTTQRALAGAHPGAVVLMHDIHPSTAKALPGLIDALQKQGYTLVRIDDLIPDMKPDGAYYSASQHTSNSATTASPGASSSGSSSTKSTSPSNSG